MTQTTIETIHKRRLLGPATILALLLVIGIAATGKLARTPAPNPNLGRIAFEADRHGRLQRVNAPGHSAASPLWKPTPDLILARAGELKLTADQLRRLTKIDNDWKQDKKLLEAEMARVANGAKPVKSGASDQLMRDLRGYSELSRQYDARRTDCWNRALSQLTLDQRIQFATAAGSLVPKERHLP